MLDILINKAIDFEFGDEGLEKNISERIKLAHIENNKSPEINLAIFHRRFIATKTKNNVIKSKITKRIRGRENKYPATKYKTKTAAIVFAKTLFVIDLFSFLIIILFYSNK